MGALAGLGEGEVLGRADAGDEDAVVLQHQRRVLVGDPDRDPAAELVALVEGALLGLVGGRVVVGDADLAGPRADRDRAPVGGREGRCGERHRERRRSR